MELRHLRYFLAVAEELSFRRAAQRLHVTQPTLSVQVRQLEEQLGVTLFERDTHHVRLTVPGMHFQEHARDLVRRAADARLRVRRVASGETGELSVGFVASLGHGLLPRVVRDYRRKFPGVELHLFQMETAQQIEALANRRLDLGFIGMGLSADLADLEIAPVADERLMAAFPEDHPLLLWRGRPRKSIPLGHLQGEPFLFASRKSAPLFNPWLLLLCRQAGFQPEVVREEGEPVTVLNYVAAGLGVSILPEQFSKLFTVGVAFLPLARPVPRYRYCAAWLPGNHHAALLRFVEAAQAQKKLSM